MMCVLVRVVENTQLFMRSLGEQEKVRGNKTVFGDWNINTPDDACRCARK